MKKKGLNITFLFLVYQLCVYSQIDTLNNFNEKGKKQGYWKCYLDKEFKVVDSSKAVFYFYQFYDNGKRINEIRGKTPKKTHIKSLLLKNDTTSGIIALSGNLKFYKNGSKVTGYSPPKGASDS